MNKFILILFIIGLNSISCSTKKVLQKGRKSSFYIAKFHEGIRAQLNDDHSKAIDCFEYCIANEPNLDAPYFALHKSYSELNNIQKSHEFIEKSYLIDPQNIQYSEMLFNSYQKIGNFKKASELTRQRIKKEPYNKELYFKTAFCYSKSKEFKKAISILNSLENKAGTSPEIYTYKFGVWKEANNSKNALKVLKTGYKEYPQDPNLLSYLIDHFIHSNQKKEAKTLLQSLIEVQPENGNIALLLGNIYLEERDSLKAFGAFKQALHSKEIDQMTSSDLFLIMKSSWKNDKELGDLIFSYSLIYPKNPVIISILADYYIQTNQSFLALETYKKVIEINPSLKMVWEEVMALEYEFEQWKKLSMDAQEYSTIFPFSALGYYAKGIAEIECKNYDLARKNLNEAKDNLLNDETMEIEIEGMLGEIAILKGDTTSGKKQLEKAISKNPKNPFILKRYLNLAQNVLIDIDLSNQLLNQFCLMIGSGNECVINKLNTYLIFKQQKKALELIDNHDEKMKTNYLFVELKGDYFKLIGEITKATDCWNKSYEIGNRSDRILLKLKRHD